MIPEKTRGTKLEYLDNQRKIQVQTWFLAASPTNLSESVNATYEGVIRFP
jgi:hypothetical protein